jgi:DNA-directed RNA polymerase specialized sigma24 family protein
MTHWERAFTELVRVRGTSLTRYAEIAERLGCKAGTVKRHLSDAMARMARHVEITEEGRVP